MNLSNTQLFRGIEESDVHTMLHCLGARERSFRKGETILHEGEETSAVGIVLTGRALVEHSDCMVRPVFCFTMALIAS